MQPRPHKKTAPSGSEADASKQVRLLTDHCGLLSLQLVEQLLVACRVDVADQPAAAAQAAQAAMRVLISAAALCCCQPSSAKWQITPLPWRAFA